MSVVRLPALLLLLMPVFLLLLMEVAILQTPLLLAGARAAVHPISVTETDVFVTRTRAIVRIQLFAEDLLMFQDLEPDAMDVVSPADLRRGLEQHKAFLLEKVTLRDATGEAWSGSVTDLKPFDIPEAGIPVSDLMLHSATYQLEFPFEEPPEFLTIQQDISDANFIFPSEMKLSVHQTGSDLTFTDSLKAGGAVTLRFDWTSTPLADDASDLEWETWFEKQREATLGITSYSSVYSFIYLEPAEVRHEILIPLASLKTILPLKHQDPSFIEVEEQDAVRDLIQLWLKDVNPTTINEQPVEPEFTRIDFYGLDLKDFARQADARRISLASGRIGIILTYRPPDDIVRSASLNWDRFHSTIRKIQSVIFTYPDGIEKFEFSRFNKPEDNIFRWQCPEDALPGIPAVIPVVVADRPQLRLPLVSLCLAFLAVVVVMIGRSPTSVGRFRRSPTSVGIAGGLLAAAGFTTSLGVVRFDHPFQEPPDVEPQHATELLQTLQSQTYEALNAGSEDRILKVLETAVDGPLQEEIYLQIRRSLEMREQGGAVARVRSITFDNTALQPRSESSPPWPGFTCQSTWTLAGTVEHWGHIHERQNQFEATCDVEPRDGSWKITRMDVQNQQQRSQRTTVRKF